jgi:phosphatidate cytidylyltransferase
VTSGGGGKLHPGDPWSEEWESAIPLEEEEEEWPYDESVTLSDAEREVAELEETGEVDEVSAEVAAEDSGEAGEEPVAETEEVAEEPAAEVEEEVAEEPVAETEEVAEEPVAEVEEEVAEEPVAETEEVAEEPAAEVEEEVAEEPVAETEEVAEEPAAVIEEVEEEPVAEVEEPAAVIEEVAEVEEPAAVIEEVEEKPVAEEPVAEVELVAEEPAAVIEEVEEEPVAEEPVAEVELVAEEPVAEVEEVAEEPVAEVEEVAEEPVAEVEEVAEEPVAEVELVAEEAAEAPDEVVEWFTGPPTEADVIEIAEDIEVGSIDAAEELTVEDVLDEEDASFTESDIEVLKAEDGLTAAEVYEEDHEDEALVDQTEAVAANEAAAADESVEAKSLVAKKAADQVPSETVEPAALAEELHAVEVAPEFESRVPDLEEAAAAGEDFEQPTLSAALGESDLIEVSPEDLEVEDARPEFVDAEPGELQADTAEHVFDIEEFEHSEHEMQAAEELTLDEPDLLEPPIPEFEFEVPEEFAAISADVDETAEVLAAWMKSAEVLAEGEAEPLAAEPVALVPKPYPPETQLPDRSEPTPVAAAAAPGPLTREEEIVASLVDDMEIVDFETFAQGDYEGGYVQRPTQEHLGLAEAMAEAPQDTEVSALTAAMPGVEQGHVGFDDFADLHEGAEGQVATGEEGVEPYESDLTLRVTSAVILVMLLVGSLWVGGIVFPLFIIVVAMAALIEFYDAVRGVGYRPVAIFGFLGGLGAMIGTYVHADGAVADGPIAVPAAFALSVVAMYAWYGSQEQPPLQPWRNGVVTMLGLAWIPMTLAFVIPLNELARSDRFQLVFVLLVTVAAFDVGSYFIGRALGTRQLAPRLSPHKTVEGLLGGSVTTLLVVFVIALASERFTAGNSLALAAALIVVSPLGDLAESMVKRSLGLKDIGQLIPGHGGILDRIDSYLFAVPIAYLIFRWTGLI